MQPHPVPPRPLGLGLPPGPSKAASPNGILLLRVPAGSCRSGSGWGVKTSRAGWIQTCPPLSYLHPPMPCVQTASNLPAPHSALWRPAFPKAWLQGSPQEVPADATPTPSELPTPPLHLFICHPTFLATGRANVLLAPCPSRSIGGHRVLGLQPGFYHWLAATAAAGSPQICSRTLSSPWSSKKGTHFLQGCWRLK